MKNTQTFEIVGIGEVRTFPIKVERKRFPLVNKDGIEVTSKRSGESSHLVFVTADGNECEKNETFYLVGDKKVNTIARTSKVSKFEIVDREDISNFCSESQAILDYSDTTFKNFEREVGDKAIKFTLKKSSVGEKFDTAYIAKFQGHLVMWSGVGTISEGLKVFQLMKQTEKVTKQIKDTIEIKAEDIPLELIA